LQYVTVLKQLILKVIAFYPAFSFAAFNPGNIIDINTGIFAGVLGALAAVSPTKISNSLHLSTFGAKTTYPRKFKPSDFKLGLHPQTPTLLFVTFNGNCFPLPNLISRGMSILASGFSSRTFSLHRVQLAGLCTAGNLC